jgi:2-Cys peroxiredoxin 5
MHQVVCAERLAMKCCWNTAARNLRTSAAVLAPIKPGDKLPSVPLFEGSPANKVNLAELIGNKKAIVFAVPGAFTPGCTKTHLPGYVEKAKDLKAKGVEVIACISVNDPFVMDAWGKSQQADGKIHMLADTSGAFTKAVDMEIDMTAALGNKRSKRYSLVVDKGVVKYVNVEPDGKGLTCSLAPEIFKQI